MVGRKKARVKKVSKWYEAPKQKAKPKRKVAKQLPAPKPRRRARVVGKIIAAKVEVQPLEDLVAEQMPEQPPAPEPVPETVPKEKYDRAIELLNRIYTNRHQMSFIEVGQFLVAEKGEEESNG